MSYQINPCKAVNEKLSHETSNCNINEMNNLCYSICNAFGNPDGCKDQCASMISSKKKMMGYDDCNKRTPYPPPIWNQISRPFPSLFREFGGDIDKAYNQCCKMAAKSQYPNSMREMCRLDASAVVYGEKDDNENVMSGGGEVQEKEEDGNNNKEMIFYMFLVGIFLAIMCALCVQLV